MLIQLALSKRALTKILTENLGLKMFALMVSIILFSLVHSEEDAQRSILMDVVAILPPPDSERMLISELPDQVKVTMRGSRSQINAIHRDDFPPVQMDLTEVDNRYYYFDPSSIDVPAAVQIVQIEPATVQLTWATLKESKVPIKERLTGRPEVGLEVKRPVVIIPAEVTLRGPEAEVQTISAVYTDVIAIDGLGPGKHEKSIPLEPPTGHVTYVEDEIVLVRLNIAPIVGERVLSHLELAAVGNASVSFRPKHVSVTLSGPSKKLPNINPEQVVPYVDTSALTHKDGAQAREVKLRGVPEGFQVVRVSPAEVIVKPR